MEYSQFLNSPQFSMALALVLLIVSIVTVEILVHLSSENFVVALKISTKRK